MLLLAAALSIVETIALQGPLHHVQGIDVDDESLWVSSVDREQKRGFLFKLNRHTGQLIHKVEVQNGERYHPGGLTLDGENIWLPVAEYRRSSTSVIQLRDKRTLRLLRQFDVNDHIGCVAASGHRLYGGNWDSRQIYEWDKTGKQLAVRPNLTGTRYQDMKYIDNRLVGGGLRGPGKGAIDYLNPKSGELLRRIDVQTTDRGVVYTNEGMTVRAGRYYLLPEDDPSRLLILREE
jgi:hypothetical protein